MEDNLLARLRKVQKIIETSCDKVGRSADSVTLIAVTKTKPVLMIEEAYACGVRIVGENRVQEALEKQAVIAFPDLQWHLIGHLQGNKVSKAVGRFAYIHSVDSVEVASKISGYAGELNISQRVLLQVHLGNEETKSGFDYHELMEQFNLLRMLQNLDIVGLMAIPPFCKNPEGVRPYFRELRELRNRLQTEFSFSLPHLSMGMSHDFEVAIEEGATMVRVGTALFGERGREAFDQNLPEPTVVEMMTIASKNFGVDDEGEVAYTTKDGKPFTY